MKIFRENNNKQTNNKKILANTIERTGQKYVSIISMKEFLCDMILKEMEKEKITENDRGRAEAIKEIYKFVDSL